MIQETFKLKKKIRKLFKGRPYYNETVVTICEDPTRDLEENNQPFIRLVNADQEHTKEMIEKLQTLELDIEHLKLNAFIPKKK